MDVPCHWWRHVYVLFCPQSGFSPSPIASGFVKLIAGGGIDGILGDSRRGVGRSIGEGIW